MFNFKRSTAVLALSAAVVSPSALAQLSGNVGTFTEYMFRGIQQSDGVAVQGGLDYGHDSGLYAGTWLSNVDFVPEGGEFETDLYAGWAGDMGGLSLDVGVLYYYYRATTDINTVEFYGGAGTGPFSFYVYYTPEYFGSSDEGIYTVGSAEFPLTETLSVGLSVGYSFGDGVEDVIGDEYLDYSVSLNKDLGSGFGFSIAFVGVDDSDIQEERVVLGLTKDFDL